MQKFTPTPTLGKICQRLVQTGTLPWHSHEYPLLPASPLFGFNVGWHRHLVSVTQPDHGVEAPRNPRINVYEVICDENPDIQSESMLWRVMGKKTFNTEMRIDARYSSFSNDASAAPSALIDNAFPSQKNTNHSRQLASENVYRGVEAPSILCISAHKVICDENPDLQSKSILSRFIGFLARADASTALSAVIDKVFPFTETGNHSGEAVFENVIEQWSDTTLKAYLESRGVPVPPAWGRDEVLAEVRRHEYKVGADSAPAMSSEDTSISPGAADATFDNWSDDHLQSYLATYGMKNYKGSTRQELIFMAKTNTRYFVFGSLTAEYIDLIQEYPAAKSFLRAGDDIQLREILEANEATQYLFSKALQGAAWDLARELTRGLEDADREDDIVDICHQGLLDGIFLPARVTRLLYMSSDDHVASHGEAPAAAEDEAHCDDGYSRKPVLYLDTSAANLVIMRRKSFTFSMDDGSNVNPGFAGAFVGLKLLFEFCQGEGYGHLQPQIFENGLSTQARKNACEAWCTAHSWTFLQQEPVDTYTVLFQVLQQLKRLIVAAADATHALHAHQKEFDVTLKDLQRDRMDLEIMCEAFACGMCLCTADKRFYQRFSPYLGAIGKCDVVWAKQTRVASSD